MYEVLIYALFVVNPFTKRNYCNQVENGHCGKGEVIAFPFDGRGRWHEVTDEVYISALFVGNIFVKGNYRN